MLVLTTTLYARENLPEKSALKGDVVFPFTVAQLCIFEQINVLLQFKLCPTSDDVAFSVVMGCLATVCYYEISSSEALELSWGDNGSQLTLSV